MTALLHGHQHCRDMGAGGTHTYRVQEALKRLIKNICKTLLPSPFSYRECFPHLTPLTCASDGGGLLVTSASAGVIRAVVSVMYIFKTPPASHL